MCNLQMIERLLYLFLAFFFGGAVFSGLFLVSNRLERELKKDRNA